ncbi:DUF4911 domain-containing protein [Fundidesulfovibrio terrae]|uniref:DUF4911 domain-containing protein n=1 Tax=Fundidesulfovibrio terrae TaxID=2922866 RepID=UPI001FAF87E2
MRQAKRRRGSPHGDAPAFEPAPRKRKTPYRAPQRSSRLYVKLASADFALFKFLLEAHGHLGIMTVMDRHAAVAKLSYSPDCEREMRAFLEEAETSVAFEVIDF